MALNVWLLKSNYLIIELIIGLLDHLPVYTLAKNYCSVSCTSTRELS